MFDEKFLSEFADRLADRVSKVVVMPSHVSQRMFSIRQAAEYLGRSEKAVRHLITRGTVPVTKIDGKVQVDRKVLDKLIDDATHYEVAA